MTFHSSKTRPHYYIHALLHPAAHIPTHSSHHVQTEYTKTMRRIAVQTLLVHAVIAVTVPPATPAPASFVPGACSGSSVSSGGVIVYHTLGKDAQTGEDQVQFRLTLDSGSSPQWAAVGFADDTTAAGMNGLSIVACSTSVNPQGYAPVSGPGAPGTPDNTETIPGTSAEDRGKLTCTFQRNIYDVDPGSSTKSLVFGTDFALAITSGTGEVGSTWAQHASWATSRTRRRIYKCDTPVPPTYMTRKPSTYSPGSSEAPPGLSRAPLPDTRSTFIPYRTLAPYQASYSPIQQHHLECRVYRQRWDL